MWSVECVAVALPWGLCLLQQTATADHIHEYNKTHVLMLLRSVIHASLHVEPISTVNLLKPSG